MSDFSSTLKDSDTLRSEKEAAAESHPGLALLFSCGRPSAVVLPLADSCIELGRGTHGLEPDPRMSRRHAQVSFQAGRFLVTDLGSQNGTWVDGAQAPAQKPVEAQRVVRMGDSMFGVYRNIKPLAERGVVVSGGKVTGPALQDRLAAVRLAAKFGDSLHITGESGTGKEVLAHAYHDSGARRDGPFVAVNCAAIPQGLAERLLFGTRRGAYSGADSNAEGYIQAASGGTLFLDEIGELDLHIQAKLLRVIEARELLPLGASRPHTVDLQVCSATNKDLKVLAANGRFREDLYYRIGRPVVSIPPLRKRPEEIPFLIESAIKRTTMAIAAHVSLVEVCVLRPWPGNIRELLVEIRSAAQTAISQGSSRIDVRHLAPGAGTVLRAPADGSPPDYYVDPTPSPPSPKRPDPAEHLRIESALRCHHGNVSGAARALGLHRTQLRRLLERHGIDPQRFADDPKAHLDLDES